MARVYMYVRYAKGHMLYLVGLIDSVRYDLSCSYTLLPTPRAFYLCALVPTVTMCGRGYALQFLI